MEEENLEVDFEEIMDQDSDEESVLSNDTGFASDASEYEIDLEEKCIPAAEIRTLNDRTRYCMIQSYYTTGGPLTVCAACIVLLANIDTVGMKNRDRERHKCANITGAISTRSRVRNMRPACQRVIEQAEIHNEPVCS
ncbi:hypothetical protein ALC57_10683 [Trachymyrmex cornetzi]|uniref:Uncharacterized protein n=1 Tax=Trachymyrmex cornetzi TaxID=471704 RepID=A0A151J3Z6_9HYME|nr:hypothetical protein ALC57_10683 [Trachymyrmex cornetzi]